MNFEERQTTLKCYCSGDRCFQTSRKTYLVCHQTGKQVLITQVTNVPWASYRDLTPKDHFVMLLAPLPEECSSFDVTKELYNEPEFVIRDLVRNNADVYQICIP